MFIELESLTSFFPLSINLHFACFKSIDQLWEGTVTLSRPLMLGICFYTCLYKAHPTLVFGLSICLQSLKELSQEIMEILWTFPYFGSLDH